MSLHVHHTVQIHDEIEKIWDDYRKSSAAVRFSEIDKFLKEQSIYCVWIRWPLWPSVYSDPVIYIPAEITGVDVKTKRVSKEQVVCMKVQHEFVYSGSPMKPDYTLKAELHDCHFIKDHSWTSDALQCHRQAARRILQRYIRLKSASRQATAHSVMQQIAKEVYEEAERSRRMMATTPTSAAASASFPSSKLGPDFVTPTPSMAAWDATEASTSYPETTLPSNRFKRSLNDAGGEMEDEAGNLSKRRVLNAGSQLPRTIKQEEAQVILESPYQGRGDTSSVHVSKLTKATEGITKAASLIAATEEMVKVLEEQIKTQLGDTSEACMQARDVVLQLQRIGGDLSHLASEIE